MIRPYAATNLTDVLDIWYRASLVAHPFLSEQFLDDESQQIAEQWLPAAETLVYEIGGKAVGFQSLVGTEVGGLFVAPEHHVGAADVPLWTEPGTPARFWLLLLGLSSESSSLRHTLSLESHPAREPAFPHTGAPSLNGTRPPSLCRLSLPDIALRPPGHL